ncbi:MAG: hypothetical protein Q9174_002523 [Haloplaca sp. 1 TL-2023]
MHCGTTTADPAIVFYDPKERVARQKETDDGQKELYRENFFSDVAGSDPEIAYDPRMEISSRIYHLSKAGSHTKLLMLRSREDKSSKNPRIVQRSMLRLRTRTTGNHDFSGNTTLAIDSQIRRDAVVEVAAVDNALQPELKASFVAMHSREQGLTRKYLALIGCDNERVMRDVYNVGHRGFPE